MQYKIPQVVPRKYFPRLGKLETSKESTSPALSEGDSHRLWKTLIGYDFPRESNDEETPCSEDGGTGSKADWQPGTVCIKINRPSTIGGEKSLK